MSCMVHVRKYPLSRVTYGYVPPLIGIGRLGGGVADRVDCRVLNLVDHMTTDDCHTGKESRGCYS